MGTDLRLGEDGTIVVSPGNGERGIDLVARQLLVQAATGSGNEKTRQQMVAEIKAYAAELAGASPSPAERMLAEVAAVDWFAHRTFESRYAGNLLPGRSLSLAQSEHHQRRTDRAHRRLMLSLKMLATVRRLVTPAVQINLARQQVNFAGPNTLTSSDTQD